MLITINIYEEQKMIDITIVIHSKKNSENIFVRKKNEMNEKKFFPKKCLFQTNFSINILQKKSLKKG